MIQVSITYKDPTTVSRLEKFNIPLKPNALNRKLQLTLKIMRAHYPNFTDVHAMRLKQYVRKFTVELHAHFCLKTKQAVPLSWPDARRLAKLLWLTTLDPSLIRPNSILLRKSAALALMFGTATGARWADIHRLRWEDVSKVRVILLVIKKSILSFRKHWKEESTFKFMYATPKTIKTANFHSASPFVNDQWTRD